MRNVSVVCVDKVPSHFVYQGCHFVRASLMAFEGQSETIRSGRVVRRAMTMAENR